MLIAGASRASARIKAAAQQAHLVFLEGVGRWANFIPANPEPPQLLAAFAAAAFVGAKGFLCRFRRASQQTSVMPLRRNHGAEKEVVST